MRDPSALQVESFLEMMSAERGAATNTLQSYERDLEDAKSFLNERNVRLTEATPDDLRAYLGHLAETRPWLAGEAPSFADLAAAAHLSTLDYLGEVFWEDYEPVKSWYALLKSRPSFRPLLADRVAGFIPSGSYADLDF